MSINYGVVAEPVTYMMVVVFEHSTKGLRIYKVCRLHGASIRLYFIAKCLNKRHIRNRNTILA